MRVLLLFFLAYSAAAQSGPRVQISNTTESLRGVSAVSRQIAWASGTHGTYLRTVDGGRTWTPAQVPDATAVDFRAVVAFSADEAFLMSAGPGDQSRIYHTSNAGKSWELEFTNTNPKGFFDSMVFWDPKHGVVLGDPIPDDTGKPKFELLKTEDGQTWRQIPPQQLPEALEGEGAFAASNSCIAVDFSQANPNLWFATGGKAARVFHSSDAGETWGVYSTPILHGQDSTGIFSIAFRNNRDGVIAGGDYKHPRDDGPNLAFTHDGGKTWDLATIHPLAYFSAVAYDHKVNDEARQQSREQVKAELTSRKIKIRPEPPQRLFIVGQNFVFDFRPPHDPRRIGGKKKQGIAFNAVSPYPEGGALIVGPKGSIAFIP